MKSIQNSTQNLYWRDGSVEWIQPRLYGNGAIGSGDVIGVQFYSEHGGGTDYGDTANPYKLFQPNTGSIDVWGDENWSRGHIKIYFPIGIALTSVYLTNNRPSGWADPWGTMYDIGMQASHDNSTWVTLYSGGSLGSGGSGTFSWSNNVNYQYYILNFHPGSGAYNDRVTIKNIKLGGVQACRDTATQATATSTDVVNAYKLSYRENKYWGLG